MKNIPLEDSKYDSIHVEEERFKCDSILVRKCYNKQHYPNLIIVEFRSGNERYYGCTQYCIHKDNLQELITKLQGFRG